MPAHQVVEVGDLVGGVVEARSAGCLEQEERVVVGGLIAAIAAQEGADGEIRRGLDLVGGDESETVPLPALRGAEVGHVQNDVAQAHDIGRAGGDGLGGPQASSLIGAATSGRSAISRGCRLLARRTPIQPIA